MITCQSTMMTICSSVVIMTLYYTDVASIVHSFDRKQCISDIGSDNVAYGHACVEVLKYHIII